MFCGYTQTSASETTHRIIEAITIFLIVLTITVYLILGITYFLHWFNSGDIQVEQSQPQRRIRRARSRQRRQRRRVQRQTSVRRRHRQRVVQEHPDLEEVFVPIPGTNQELRLTVRPKNRKVTRRHRTPEYYQVKHT